MRRFDDLKAITMAYAYENQVAKLVEEMVELTEELMKPKPDRERCLDELADVRVLVNQMAIYLGLTDAEVKHRMDEKIDRQLNRIAKINKGSDIDA